MAEQRDFVDFKNGGDTGQDNLSSIQPYSTGEGATQIVLRRPPENNRSRTEILRRELNELKYYRDYGHLMLEYSIASTVAWGGATDDTGTGIITANGSMRITPFLAPKAGIKATLVNGTPASNQITYAVTTGTYATDGVNAITIEHRTVASGSHSASITTGPVKRILVLFDSANAAHTAAATATLVTAAIAADTAGDPTYGLTGKLTAVATDAVTAIAVLAETRLEGTADDELHVVPGATLQTFTTSNPLAKGEGVAIWYRNVIEPAAGDPTDPKVGADGGRAESTNGRSNTTIPIGSLFKVSAAASAYKIPGAISICRVGDNGQLIFFDGTRVQKNETITFASPTSIASAALTAHISNLATINGAGIVGYNGSGNWADLATNVSSSNVEAAIDEIVSDLAAFTATSPGANRIGVDASTIFTGALTAIGGGGALTAANTTIRTVLDQLDAAVIARRAYTAVCTDNVASIGGDYNAATLFASVNTFGSGRYLVRRGAYTTAVDLSTVYGASLIGEALGLTTLSASVDVKLVASDPVALHEFENVYFTVSSPTASYNFSNRPLVLKNCRAQAGVLTIAHVATSAPTRVSIDGLLIDTDNSIDSNNSLYIHNNANSGSPITGIIRNLQIRRVNSLNSGTTAKYALRIEALGNAGDKAGDALTFENCVIDPSTGFGAFPVAGAALYISQSYQPIVFQDCLIRCSQTAQYPHVLQIVDSVNITFENCTFVQDGNGKTLSITGTSSDITFINCKFYTSTLTIWEDEFNAICTETSSTIPAKAISFINGYLEVRRGDGTNTPRITLNRSAGVDAGTGPIVVDGLQIVLNYASSPYMNRDFFVATTGLTTTPTSSGSIRSLSIDFRLKRLVENAVRAVLFKGSITQLRVTDLVLEGVAEPHNSVASNDTCVLVALYTAAVVGGNVRGTAQGANVASWKAIFELNDPGDSVENIRFWDDDTINLGRVIDVLSGATRSHVVNNTVIASNLASGENAEGWFCRMNGQQSIVVDNTILVSGTVGALSSATDNHALVLVTSGGDQCVVKGNTLRIGSGIHGITLNACNYSTVIGNTIRATHTAVANVIVIVATAVRNTIVGNTGFNTDGGFGAALADAGTSTQTAGNSFEP